MKTNFKAASRVLILTGALLPAAAFVPQSLAGDLGAGQKPNQVPVARSSQSPGRDMKLQAQLIWGTNIPKSPDASHKPAEADVQRKLKSLPFRWDNYFEVNHQHFTVAKNADNKVAMSKDCEVSVKNLGNSVVEVSLFGKGQRVSKITQALPKGEMLVTGGNAPSSNGWFVVLKQGN